MGDLVLLVGGQKSGKSNAAMALARQAGRPLRLLAPAVAGDDELAERIERHREDRAGDVSVEETFALAASLRTHDGDAIVIDAIDTWLLHRMQATGLFEVGSEPTPLGPSGRAAQGEVLASVDELLEVIADRTGPTFVIAGMVGAGMHGATPIARRYEDLHGLATQRLGRAAQRSLLVVAGRAIDLVALDVLPPPEVTT